MIRRLILFTFAALAAAAVLAPAPSHAVSSFARLYGMDCKTCHDVIPHRNEFGQAFEKAGYLWPTERPAEPVENDDFLGISGIMGSIPLAVTVTHSFGYDPEGEIDKTNSDSLAQLHLAGAIGDRVGFFAHNLLSSGELLSVVQLLPEEKVSLRIGNLTPRTTLRKPNQTYTFSPPLPLSFSVTGEPAMGAVRDAAELDVILGSRAQIALGAVDRDNQKANEYYAHASYKIGGTDMTGREPELDLDAEGSVWDYLAVTVGGFGYAGETELTDTKYYRWGGEAELLYRKLSVLLGGYGAYDETDGGDGLKIDSALFSGEIDYRFMTELLGVVRVESERIGNAENGDLFRAVGALNWMVRQNVVLRVEGSYREDDETSETAGVLTLLLHI